VAASLVQAHPRTLRIYEDEGLLAPARTPTNIRLYSENDIRRILWIRRLTQERGVNLAGVKLLFELEERLGTRLLEALFDDVKAREAGAAAAALQAQEIETADNANGQATPAGSAGSADPDANTDTGAGANGTGNGSFHGRFAGQVERSDQPAARPITHIVATRVTTPRGDSR
jgi:MerR family transcriptional regulator/heat shock protein HspR